jgi:hypothetical protein
MSTNLQAIKANLNSLNKVIIDYQTSSEITDSLVQLNAKLQAHANGVIGAQIPGLGVFTPIEMAA